MINSGNVKSSQLSANLRLEFLKEMFIGLHYIYAIIYCGKNSQIPMMLNRCFIFIHSH